MDPRLRELELHLRHRHSDGSWSPLVEEVSASHDPASTDAERKWGLGRLFRCVGCGEEVAIEADEPRIEPGVR